MLLADPNYDYYMTLQSSMETVQEWMELLSKGNFDEAAEFLVEDVKAVSPKTRVEGKENWRDAIPAVIKKGPTWDDPIPGDHESQVITNGTMKVGFVTVKCRRVIELNREGQIQAIVVSSL